MEYTETFYNGWEAHRKNVSVSDNPYNEKTQTYSYEQWEYGWVMRNEMFKTSIERKADGSSPSYNY